ncbi:MAG: hypothetical protein LBC96_07620 [Lachnospiraceae bacterium]|jgi:hypothetical protein|nr:hypothetical protein [Lachnospiraceae bacterium]
MKRFGKLSSTHENLVLAVIFCILLIAVIAVRYGFYYALNDDSLIKDISAGIYTGSPESRNIQMHYPVSALLGLLYRILPLVPWSGVFLIACHFTALFLIVRHGLVFYGKRGQKITFLIVMLGLTIATMLEHLVFIQYTVTSAMLTAAAAFCFLTRHQRNPSLPSPQDEPVLAVNTAEKTALPKSTVLAFIRFNIPVIVLAFLAFVIRWEMLLLTLPMLGVAGLYKWQQEVIVFCKVNFQKYFALFGIIVVSIFVGHLLHVLAYSSPEWRQSMAFFDNRVELYDYQFIPRYDEHADFYQSVGMTAGEVRLLTNYNFGLSDIIDEDILASVAAYARTLRGTQQGFGERLSEAVQLYLYNLRSSGEHGDFPYNSLVIIGYTALLGFGIIGGRLGRMVFSLSLLAATRSALWLYIIYGGRFPLRISHSLYFVEISILLAMVLLEVRCFSKERADDKEIALVGTKIKTAYPVIITVITLMIIIAAVPASMRSVAAEYDEREQINTTWNAMRDYTRSRSDSYFFIDVYSSVIYSEKVFEKLPPRPANYDIMGGWASKSPLYQKKMNHFFPLGHSMRSAIADLEHVYFLCDQRFSVSWLIAYYHEHGREVTIEAVDIIDERLIVYMVR